ncbi:MAG: NAD(P)-dependent oxidoreductase [Myxococcota bacterium]|nr:NAD(P)-dependent oxidoreductase [Myxococcota bacterium]
MRLIITGGSSFVGAWTCLRAARSHSVFALHHSTALRLPGVTPVRTDLRRARDVRRLGGLGADAVLHLAAKVKGTDAPAVNRAMMDAVLSLGLPTLYLSTTVVHWDHPTPYGVSRREDEARLAASGLPYAVLRPSAPYGPRLIGHRPSHTESFHTLAGFVRRGVVPIIGDGRYRRQPVHVDDLSDAMLALVARGLCGQTLDIGGGDALRFVDLVDALAASQGRRVLKLSLPKRLFVYAAARSRDFDPTLIDAVDADETVDNGPLMAATGLVPRVFVDGAADVFR